MVSKILAAPKVTVVKMKTQRKRVSRLWMILSAFFAASVLLAAPEFALGDGFYPLHTYFKNSYV